MHATQAMQRRTVDLRLPESVCAPVGGVNNYSIIVVFKVKEHSVASLFDLPYLAGRKFNWIYSPLCRRSRADIASGTESNLRLCG